MILVLFFLGIIFLIFLVILFSNLKIKIINVRVEKFSLNKEFKLFIQIYFLNKVKIFSKKINIKKIHNILQDKKIKKQKANSLKFNYDLLKELLKIKPKIEMLKFDVCFGNDDACITSCVVTILNILISIFLPYFSQNKEKINYSVKAKYNQNILKIQLDSIISIKIVHIIYVIFRLIKKGMRKNERASNRRFNAYCNE